MSLDDQEAEMIELDAEELPGLAGVIQQRFIEAEEGRYAEEARWLKAYKNYRGISDTSTAYSASEKSKVFIKITKVKVLAAFGQIVDILFSNNKFPLRFPVLLYQKVLQSLPIFLLLKNSRLRKQ